MPSEINIEKMITEAMARGEFSGLKGEGKPLDLDPYFTTPEDVRLGFSLLNATDYIPEEVVILRDMADLKGALKTQLTDQKRLEIEKRFARPHACT